MYVPRNVMLTGLLTCVRTCVWVYVCVCAGFMYVPRNVMLLIGLLTCAIGPALVLVVLGCFAGALLCMVIIKS
jgi:hypothetical protein